MRYIPKSASGFNVVQIMGMFFLAMMSFSIVIDLGFYHTVENQMQTAVDSAALAAVTSMYRDVSVDPQEKMDHARSVAEEMIDTNMLGHMLEEDDVIFGFVDPFTRTYDPDTFRTPSTNPDYSSTGGYNAVWVRLRKGGQNAPNEGVRTIMANLFDIGRVNAQAQSVALMDQTVSGFTDGGLRPIYVCEAQFNRTMEDGVPENNVVRIYGSHVEVDGVQTFTGCPSMSSGNWGFADLRDCTSGTVGASTIGEWFANGYPGTVNVGQCYSTKPGNFISSISPELDVLIQNQTIFPVPLYDDWDDGGGSTANVHVSGFVGFKITGYVQNGPQEDRYIEGRFYRFACRNGCFSSRDVTSTSPGRSVVKLRLASRT